MRFFALALGLAALTACGVPTTQSPPGPALPDLASDTCSANTHKALVGQDATALERVLILGQVRVIRPGMAVSMDFRPERINFQIDQNGRVARIFCG